MTINTTGGLRCSFWDGYCDGVTDQGRDGGQALRELHDVNQKIFVRAVLEAEKVSQCRSR